MKTGYVQAFWIPGVLDTPVPGIRNPLSLGANYANGCAVAQSGVVRCWGRNDKGQLGNPWLRDSALPVIVPGIKNAVSVATSYDNTCALLANGVARCWGPNAPSDVTVSGATSISMTATWMAPASQVPALHVCAALQTGGVKCWGTSNTVGENGDGSVSNVQSFAAGAMHACAVLPTGAVQCWGSEAGGVLGNGVALDAWNHGPGDTAFSASPLTVLNLSNVRQVSATSGATCALLKSGAAKCWGPNWDGMLGNGSRLVGGSSVPVDVVGL